VLLLLLLLQGQQVAVQVLETPVAGQAAELQAQEFWMQGRRTWCLIWAEVCFGLSRQQQQLLEPG
jgi:hypothetical protein